jgi:hypothetical protein
MQRVLARAAELQALSGEAAETLTDDQIIELGREVGLSAQHLRRALAEERGRRERPNGPGLLFGSPTVAAERVIRGSAEGVFAALDVWFQKEEWLQIKRQFPDRIVWEPRHDFEGGVRRLLNVGGRGYTLSRATDVGATVVPADEGRVLVRLDADLSGKRRAAVGGMLAAMAFGAAGSAVAVALNFALIAAPIPLVVVGSAGYFIARGVHAGAVSRVQLTLEQMLDRLERGERADNPSLLRMIAQAAGAVPRRY